MLNTLDTLLILDRLDNPPPSTTDFEDLEAHEGATYVRDFNEDAYEAAMDHWREQATSRAENLHAASDADALPDSPEDAILSALARSTQRVEEAEARRSEVLAVAIHVAHLSVRAIANAASLHPRTVEKRANTPEALKAVIEFKEQELEALRAQAKKSDAATSVEH